MKYKVYSSHISLSAPPKESLSKAPPSPSNPPLNTSDIILKTHHYSPSTNTSTTLHHQPGEPTEAVDRRARREAVHATQAAARARVACLVLALAGNDSCDGTSSAGSGSATGNDIDGGGCGGGGGVDVLEAAGGERGAVLADGELLEVGHCLVARGGGVDAEDHAFAAVDAVLLLAVEPCEVLVWEERGCGMGARTERVGAGNGHVPCDAGFAFGVDHETRVHASLHLLAGLGKSRLGCGVVLLHEDEHDHVANGGGDGLGGVEECWCHSGGDGLHSTDNDLSLLVEIVRKNGLDAYGVGCCS
jgi:hypothetical protein